MRKTVLTFLVLLMGVTINAQEVKNQTEHIKSLPVGKYLTYDLKSKNGKNYWVPIRLEAELASVEFEKNFKEHKYLNLKVGNSMHDKPETYLPDNMAFPATLAKITYEGNTKLQKKVGYVPREIKNDRTKRYVVLDGVIFCLHNEFNPEKPETYKPWRLYVSESYAKNDKAKGDTKKKKKKKTSFFGKLTSLSSVSASSDPIQAKLNKEDALAKVKNYLTKAFAKQKEVFPKWKNEPKNKLRLENLEIRKKLMAKAMYDYNEAYRNSDEYKRILENQKYWKKYDAENEVTITNNMGRDIYIYEDGSMNGSRLDNGGSRAYNCKKTYRYTFSGNSGSRGGNSGTIAYSANSSCGGKITVK